MNSINANTRKINDEVFVAHNRTVKVTRQDIAYLKRKAKENKGRKCRLLLHQDINDALHEMLIVHAKGQYIRPHKNVHSSKSYYIIEGSLACILFSNEGQVTDHIVMSEVSNNDVVFMRMSESRYHTLLPITDTVVFIETILGPFRGTTYAPWAPSEGESPKVQAYHENLKRKLHETGNMKL